MEELAACVKQVRKDWESKDGDASNSSERNTAQPSAAQLVPGDVLTDFAEHLYGQLSLDFNSSHGPCTIEYDDVFRETGCGPHRADDKTQQCMTHSNLDTSTFRIMHLTTF